MTERMRNDIAKSAAVIEKARRLETRLTRDALLAHAQSDHSCGPGTPHAIVLQDRASVASFANGGDNHLVGLAFEDFPIGTRLVSPRYPITADAIIDPINAACHSLNIRMFLFTDPTLLNAVIAAKRRGVHIRVMLNPVRRDGTSDNDVARKAKDDINRARRSAVLIAFVAGVAALLGAAVAWVAACAGGRDRRT